MRVHVYSDLCILIKCLREVLRLLVTGSPVQYRDRRLHPNKRRWSSPPASLPLSGGTSHSWSTPQNSAGSLRCQNSMTWPSSICFGSGLATITPWISQTPRDWVGEKVSTGVWEVSGPESKPALCCICWPRPAHLRLRWLRPVRRFPSAPESPRSLSAPESPRLPSTPKSWSRPAHLRLRWLRPVRHFPSVRFLSSFVIISSQPCVFS